MVRVSEIKAMKTCPIKSCRLPVLLRSIGSLAMLCLSIAVSWAQSYSFDRNLPAVSIGSPIGLARLSSGVVVAVDQANHRVMQIDTDGNVVRAWGTYGTGNGQFSSPSGVAVDSSNNIYVADTGNDRIQKFNSTGGYLTKWGTFGSSAGLLNLPSGVAVDSSGAVHVVDYGNCRIQKFSNTGTYLSQWGSQGNGTNQLLFPVGIAISSAGTVYVADAGNNRVATRTSTGAFSFFGGDMIGGFDHPSAVALDSTGNMYVADTNKHRILKRSASGTWTTYGTSGSGNGQLRGPEGILVDSAGKMWIAEPENHRIQRWNPSGAFDSGWGSFGVELGHWNNPGGAAVDANGNTVVADTGNHRVVVRNATGGLWSFGSFGDGAGQLDSPSGVGVDSSGIIAVADTGNHRVLVRRANGTFFSFGTFGTGNGEMVSPAGVAIASDGRFHVLDWGNHRVQVFDSAGNYQSQWGSQGSGSEQLSFPLGIAVDSAGTAFVADTYNHRIVKRTSDGVFSSLGTQGSDTGQFLYPTGVAVDGSGMVYVADSGNDRWVRCSFSGYFQGYGTTGNGNGQLSGPGGIGANSDGVIAVSDSGNHRVALWAIDDPTLPSSVLTSSPAKNSAGWNKASVAVNIVATANASGATVREIRYAVDMGSEQVVSGSTAQFTLSDDGIHSIAYWAVDSRGKVEPTRYATVRIDQTSPEIGLSIASGVLYVDTYDALSGLASVAYSIDGGPAQAYNGPVALPATADSVTVVVVDVAGNSASTSGQNAIAWLKSLTASPVTVISGGSSTVTMTLLGVAPASGLTFDIASSNAAVVAPATVTVPAGATSTKFMVTTSGVSTDTAVQITASRGIDTVSGGLVVVPPVPRTLVIKPTVVVAGATATATVTLTGAALAGGQLVQLISYDPNVATVDSTVLVAATKSSATFTVRTSAISTDKAVLIGARVGDVELVGAVRVAAVVPSSVTMAPTSAVGGGSVTGKVTLTRMAPPGGLVVSLRSTDTAASVPASVTVPAGASFATFPISTQGVALDRVVGVEASIPGKIVRASFRVMATKLSGLTFPATPVPGGDPLTGTVTLLGVAPPGGMRVRLRENSAYASVPSVVVVPQGASTATFTISTTAVPVDTVVPVNAVLNGDTRSATFKVLR